MAGDTPLSTGRQFSVAMNDVVHRELTGHLLRHDGQEDLCLALYSPSTGESRDTALIHAVALPRQGDRRVHGNATVTGAYLWRIATEASAQGLGVMLLHSHPRGRGWQGMSDADADAEASYANLVLQVTGLPLVGMTVAGDHSWSARRWNSPTDVVHARNVRVVGERLEVSWNDRLAPAPVEQPSQVRTVSAWGSRTQASIARLRVLVVGAGSVGMAVAVHLAATGVAELAVMDFDRVEDLNRDRMVFATRRDAAERVAKVEVARRACEQAATAGRFHFIGHQMPVTCTRGERAALDYDLVISCVDRPWPRAVLNQLAYSDLIPVIDGGIAIDVLASGGMRNATWRSQVVRPGRPCLACTKQFDAADVAREQAGLLDDPRYIQALGAKAPGKQNVAVLSVAVVASVLEQFVSILAAPGGCGEPGLLQHVLSTHELLHPHYETSPTCLYEAHIALGDRRIPLTKNGPAGQGAA